MRKEIFQPTTEGEARLLLLIDAFSVHNGVLDGRTKLAKLDFFLRYPNYLERALELKTGRHHDLGGATFKDTIENRMVRFRYGPWDPAYFGLLGRLIGKRLIEIVPGKTGLAYQTTGAGAELSHRLAEVSVWREVAERAALLRRHLNYSGSFLKDFIYEHFPEVSAAHWGQRL